MGFLGSFSKMLQQQMPATAGGIAGAGVGSSAPKTTTLSTNYTASNGQTITPDGRALSPTGFVGSAAPSGRILSDAEFKDQLRGFMPQWNTANSQSRMAELERNNQKGGWEYQMLADSLRPGWNVPQGEVGMSAGNQHVNQLMQYANQGVMPSADMLATAKYYDDLWNQGGPATKLPMITSGGQDWSSGYEAVAPKTEVYGPRGLTGAGGNWGTAGGSDPAQWAHNYQGETRQSSTPPQATPPRSTQQSSGLVWQPGKYDMTPSRPFENKSDGTTYNPVTSGQGNPFRQTGETTGPSLPIGDDGTPIVPAKRDPNATSTIDDVLADITKNTGKRTKSSGTYEPNPDIEGMSSYRNRKTGMVEELQMKYLDESPVVYKLKEPVKNVTPEMWQDFQGQLIQRSKNDMPIMDAGLYTIKPAELGKTPYVPPTYSEQMQDLRGKGPGLGVDGFLERMGAPGPQGYQVQSPYRYTPPVVSTPVKQDDWFGKLFSLFGRR